MFYIFGPSHIKGVILNESQNDRRPHAQFPEFPNRDPVMYRYTQHLRYLKLKIISVLKLFM